MQNQNQGPEYICKVFVLTSRIKDLSMTMKSTTFALLDNKALKFKQNLKSIQYYG